MFIGRAAELKDLSRFLKKKTASLIVVRGRRRIGKSRLIEKFANNERFLSFAGLPPTTKTTRQSELSVFARQFAVVTGLPTPGFDDWMTAFAYLANATKQGRVIILLDEISWMGSSDPDFLGKLKTAWDQQFKQNNQLILILCGSASSWIEENILSSTGFLGRISYKLTLRELPLDDCAKFWGAQAQHVSAHEKFKLLAVTGGIPKYLEEIDPYLSAEDNIKQLCFNSGGLLVDEFKQIFNHLFLHDTEMYLKIVKLLAGGAKETKAISQALGIGQTGRLSKYLRELVLAGFLKQDYAWDLHTAHDLVRVSQYRLSDNYLRFYVKYIAKHISQIERNAYRVKTLTALPGWYSLLGLQFENLVLSNRDFLFKAMGIREEDIVNENPFFQRKTAQHPGCQIDYMIQAKFNTLYICEIKFHKGVIGSEVIAAVQEKINRLNVPKGFSFRPVLIHVNGVSQDVIDADYFAHIIALCVGFCLFPIL